MRARSRRDAPRSVPLHGHPYGIYTCNDNRMTKAERAARVRAKRKEWREAGLCIQCGRPARPSRATCEPCGSSMSAASQRYAESHSLTPKQMEQQRAGGRKSQRKRRAVFAEQRRCTSCGSPRDRDDRRYCIECRRRNACVYRNDVEGFKERAAAWARAHPEIRKAAVNGWNERNAERVREIQRAGKRRRYRLYPQRFIEWERQRRARRAGAFGSHTEAEWQAIVARQRGRCAGAGQPYQSPRCESRAGGSATQLTRDHIIPLSRGGSDMACNIQGLCRPCNSKKNAKLISGLQPTIFDRVA